MVFRECLAFIKSLGSHCFQDYTRFKALCAAAIVPRAGNTHRARSMQGLANKALYSMIITITIFIITITFILLLILSLPLLEKCSDSLKVRIMRVPGSGASRESQEFPKVRGSHNRPQYAMILTLGNNICSSFNRNSNSTLYRSLQLSCFTSTTAAVRRQL